MGCILKYTEQIRRHQNESFYSKNEMKSLNNSIEQYLQ